MLLLVIFQKQSALIYVYRLKIDNFNMLDNKIEFTLKIEQNKNLHFWMSSLSEKTKQNLDCAIFRKTSRL